jgi:hypothetical protein
MHRWLHRNPDAFHFHFIPGCLEYAGKPDLEIRRDIRRYVSRRVNTVNMCLSLFRLMTAEFNNGVLYGHETFLRLSHARELPVEQWCTCNRS